MSELRAEAGRDLGVIPEEKMENQAPNSTFNYCFCRFPSPAAGTGKVFSSHGLCKCWGVSKELTRAPQSSRAFPPIQEGNSSQKIPNTKEINIRTPSVSSSRSVFNGL